MSDQGILYVIATPIGNLADITLRALNTLKEVKILLAEDTRVTKKLLDHYGIQVKLARLDDYNEERKIPTFIKILSSGDSIGLVSDAGTPLISDPGFKFVSAAQKANILVRSIPGPSAITTALSIAGIPTDRFVFEGFLPKKSAERRKKLDSLKYEARTIIFYESPKRIQKCILECVDIFGEKREVALMRELTKKFEQHQHGTLKDIKQQLEGNLDNIKGEYVLLIHGSSSNDFTKDSEAAICLLEDLQEHMPFKSAVEIVSRFTGFRRNQVYSMGIQKKTNK